MMPPMTRRRHAPCVCGLIAVAVWMSLRAAAADARTVLDFAPAEAAIHVVGSPKYDWWIERSPDLVHWERWTAPGPLMSDDAARAPVRRLGPLGERVVGYFRGVRTEGFYDSSLIRNVHLQFTQPDWQARLTSGRTTGSNVLCGLELDNGAALGGVGARYRGNSSFQLGGAKKSVNVQVDFTTATSRLLGYETFNLNNAAGDRTLLREVIYFNVMRRYAPCPQASLVRLHINGEYWGLYSLIQQFDGDLVKEWFPSSSGDRWRAPNIGGGGGRPGGGGGGGGLASGASALSWLGTDIARYRNNYELKKASDETNAWKRLVHAIDVLNNTPEALRRDAVEDVLAVDSWLWFLVIENIFADDDSYWNKGADYAFYFEPESGRMHPVEHDGNESFVARDVSLSPVAGATLSARPVISKLLTIPELRQRYLAHMRTVLSEAFSPEVLHPEVDRLSALSVEALAADTRRGFLMATYTNELRALKTFISNRHQFLTRHPELRPVPPSLTAVTEPGSADAGSPVVVTATVRGHEEEGVDSVWLWYRTTSAGRYMRLQMFDDGAHGDGEAGDAVHGAQLPAQLAGVTVRYYVEARSAAAPGAAVFFPAAGEAGPLSFRVRPREASESPVIINELMASNQSSIRDPQGQRDDWIELFNRSEGAVDLSGMFLSDRPDNPRKWSFPPGTVIPAGGYLVVWADEDVNDSPGLHAGFKLSADGEQVLLVDTDARFNALLDSVTFGPLGPDVAIGRTTEFPDRFLPVPPTPGAANP